MVSFSKGDDNSDYLDEDQNDPPNIEQDKLIKAFEYIATQCMDIDIEYYKAGDVNELIGGYLSNIFSLLPSDMKLETKLIHIKSILDAVSGLDFKNTKLN